MVHIFLIIFSTLCDTGSWHDAMVSLNLFEKVADDRIHPRPACLIADSAFPYSASMTGRIRCALRDKALDVELSRFPPGPQRLEIAAMQNELKSIRQAAEWGNKGVKGPSAASAHGSQEMLSEGH